MLRRDSDSQPLLFSELTPTGPQDSMNFLKTLPAALASMTLVAHFLRSASFLPLLFCLVLIPLCFIPLRFARAVVRGSLALGVLLWLMTAMEVWGSKLDAGLPARRSLVILLSVAAFTAFAAWLLPPVRADDEA